MKKNNLISIIIPCFNDAEFVEQSIDSALIQTYRNKEVIVVDDGSDAETKLVLKRMEPKIKKLITQENKGQSTARNIGIKEAKGDYILVLDSDDFFEPTFCEKAMKCFSNDKRVKLVTCYANLLFENRASYIYEPQGGSLTNFLTSNGALGSAIFKKEDWESCGGYDETMTKGIEDWEFYIRLLQNSGFAEVIKEPLYNYRKRIDTTTGKANSVKYILFKDIYIKHKDLYIKYYNDFIDQILAKIEHEEKEKIKNTRRLEFKIGVTVLKPFRWIKSFFK